MYKGNYLLQNSGTFRVWLGKIIWKPHYSTSVSSDSNSAPPEYDVMLHPRSRTRSSTHVVSNPALSSRLVYALRKTRNCIYGMCQVTGPSDLDKVTGYTCDAYKMLHAAVDPILHHFIPYTRPTRTVVLAFSFPLFAFHRHKYPPFLKFVKHSGYLPLRASSSYSKENSTITAQDGFGFNLQYP
jgi:hypothetical protein